MWNKAIRRYTYHFDSALWTTCLIIVALDSKTAETFFSAVPFEEQQLSDLYTGINSSRTCHLDHRDDMLSEVETSTISIIVQAVLSGVYFATFFLCLRWQIYSDDGLAMRKNIKWCMVAITIVIFAFSMADLGISLRVTLLLLNGNKVPLEDIASVRIFPVQGHKHCPELASVYHRTLDDDYYRRGPG